ncbi:MAG TPA: HAD family hydrolase [Candidatus Nanoarchaeia archaeon]|nr:HAD family hydrolase [Candidatus Nanoarchaeia archaeon]
MIKAVLFDMDGVLIDSHDAWFHIFNRAYNHFEGKTISRADFDKHLWAKAFDIVAKDRFTVPLEKIRQFYRDIYTEYRERLVIMPEAKNTLSMLQKKKIDLVVVSNSQRAIVTKVLKDVGLVDYFKFCLGGDDVKNGKPSPDILIKALEQLNLIPKDVIFIGDTIWDKMAAEKAGIKFVGFRLDGNRIEALPALVGMV